MTGALAHRSQLELGQVGQQRADRPARLTARRIKQAAARCRQQVRDPH